MERDEIDFGTLKVSVLFRKLFIPTLFGMLSISAVTVADGIFVGHGVGAELHEDPEVPNFGRAGRGPRIYEGMTIAVEPMVNAGTEEVEVQSNGWTVVTIDGKLSAHYENTIAVTENGTEILTLY